MWLTAIGEIGHSCDGAQVMIQAMHVSRCRLREPKEITLARIAGEGKGEGPVAVAFALTNPHPSLSHRNGRGLRVGGRRGEGKILSRFAHGSSV
jgi:hypothetical protein